MKTTSINQIADEMRADNRKTENEIGNLRGLFAILSTRWHGKINIILQKKRRDLRYMGHVESDLYKDYRNFKTLFNRYHDKTPEEIKGYFNNCYPGYSPIIMDMFYDLASYERAKSI